MTKLVLASVVVSALLTSGFTCVKKTPINVTVMTQEQSEVYNKFSVEQKVVYQACIENKYNSLSSCILEGMRYGP